MRAKIGQPRQKTYALVLVVLVLISTSFFDNPAEGQTLWGD
jgi:hypothetical protein